MHSRVYRALGVALVLLTTQLSAFGGEIKFVGIWRCSIAKMFTDYAIYGDGTFISHISRPKPISYWSAGHWDSGNGRFLLHFEVDRYEFDAPPFHSQWAKLDQSDTADGGSNEFITYETLDGSKPSQFSMMAIAETNWNMRATKKISAKNWQICRSAPELYEGFQRAAGR